MSFARSGKKKQEEPEVRVRVSKVSKASEMPSYKNLPRYDHVPLAVIHPHSPIKRPQTAKPPPSLEPAAVKATLKERKYEPKEFPDHLMRVPIDPNAPVRVKKVFVDTKGMTSRQKKEAMIQAAKQQQEMKRERRVKNNLHLLFGNIKKALDEKKDDEFIH